MKLTGEISVPLETHDFVEAGEHQRQLEAFLDIIRASYPGASLKLRERRERATRGPSPVAGRRVASGALRKYDE